MCNSSCVYALVGASVRDIHAAAQLGIHASSLGHIESDGRLTPLSTKMSAQAVRTATQITHERISRYLRDMRIDVGLLAAAREIPPEKPRYLSRDEIAKFGIDRREVVESP
jgi:hypothetical protein